MTARQLLAKLHRILDRRPDDWDLDVVIETNDPGIPAPMTVRVKNVGEGFDWTNGKLLIYPEVPIICKPKRPKP